MHRTALLLRAELDDIIVSRGQVTDRELRRAQHRLWELGTGVITARNQEFLREMHRRIAEL
jgi:hypothetical protein